MSYVGIGRECISWVFATLQGLVQRFDQLVSRWHSELFGGIHLLPGLAKSI